MTHLFMLQIYLESKCFGNNVKYKFYLEIKFNKCLNLMILA